MTDGELQDKIDDAKQLVKDLEMIQEGRIEVAEIEEELKRAKSSLAAREVSVIAKDITPVPNVNFPFPSEYHHTTPIHQPVYGPSSFPAQHPSLMPTTICATET